jgi:hypothetical protein
MQYGLKTWRRPTPQQHRRRRNDAAIAALHGAKQHLVEADTAINDALALLNAGGPPKPPDPPDGDVITIGPGDDLLAAIDAAPDGTIFDIDPAFRADLGDCTISKSCTLRSAVLPPAGRVGLDLAGPTLSSASVTFAAPSIKCIGLRFEGKGTTVIMAGDRTLLDRCVITGPADGGPQQRGVYANATGIRILGCHIGGIWNDVDTQAVLCTRFTKRLHINDCLLEASGENFMSGGDDGESAEETPQDILIENSTLSKPLDWQGKAGCTCKNLLELKNARRVIVRKCVLENSWADGQAGYAIVLSVRNQYGAAVWSTIEDVLIEDLTIHHCGGGVQVLGRDYSHESKVMRQVILRRITITDMSSSCQEGSAAAAAQAFLISGGPDALTLEDIDTAGDTGWMKAAIAFDQIDNPTTNLVVRRCRMYEGDYGITGQADGAIGVDQIEGHAPGYVWDTVTIVRGTSGRWINYPEGTILE